MLRATWAAVAVLTLASCGSEPERQTPSPEERRPWATLPDVSAPLPALTVARHVEIGPDGAVVVDGERRVVMTGEDGTAAAARLVSPEGELVVVVLRDAASGPVWDLVGGVLSERPVERVALAARQRGDSVGLRLHPYEERENGLGLGISITQLGLHVFGDGGVLRPGCENVSASMRDPTITAGADELSALAQCLSEVKHVFPGEIDVAIYADRDIPFDRALGVLATAGRTDLFPRLQLGTLDEAPAVAGTPSEPPEPPHESASGEDTPEGTHVERVVRGTVTSNDSGERTGPGAFDASVATRLVQSRTRAIQRCYERVLRTEPTRAGRVVVRFTIEPTGFVGGVVSTENTTGSEAIASCATDVVRRLRVDPAPEGGSVTLTYPFVFSVAE